MQRRLLAIKNETYAVAKLKESLKNSSLPGFEPGNLAFQPA